MDDSISETENLAIQRLAAIVEYSDDAILSKNLEGIIMSWNRGAERLFGYSEDEVVGKPVTILIPDDRQDEEPEILGRIRRGERIEHYETVRQRKDGSRVDISLSVSPVFDRSGRIVGASKIARDISERRRAEEQKNLLLREMNHRIKNLFALAGGLVNICSRDAETVQQLVSALNQRFTALSRVHSLTMSEKAGGSSPNAAFLQELITEVMEPFLEENPNGQRIVVGGSNPSIGPKAATHLALIVNEFATNALKYGALSDRHGRVDITCRDDGEEVLIEWTEVASERGEPRPSREGFGTQLARATVLGTLKGSFERTFTEDGVEIRIAFPRRMATE